MRRWPSWLRRLLAAGAILGAALLVSVPSAANDLEWRLGQVARGDGFNLWTWEIATLANRESQAIAAQASPNPPPTDQVDVVKQYFQLSAEADRARSERDSAWAQQAVLGTSSRLAETQGRVDDLEAQLAALRPTVEATVSSEIEAELHRQQMRDGLLTWHALPGLPFFRPIVIPGVFFQLGQLPDLLVVSPRERIALVGSVLLRPGLSPPEIDSLERGADGLDVSSVVTGIGGLAAYPSMLPDTSSPRDLLVTVAHEWTHHYLALQPLGRAYFTSYEMRSINETVADMVGHEVGGAVYETIYSPGQPAIPAPRPAAPAAATPPALGTLMRQIRTTVEGYLAIHDVAGAETYMREQQVALGRQGYYVRRLNTAYLSFFGSYSGSANPYEARLRLLRLHTGSLAAFLSEVAQIQQPSDLNRLLGQ